MTMAMGVITRAKKRRMEEEERLADRISGLPDGVLGDIVSLLPTQVLSSRWRYIWRSAPLKLELHLHDTEPSIPIDKITRVLAAHQGPGRRFSISKDYYYKEHHRLDPERAIPLDEWLRCPALQNLQELHINSNGLVTWSTLRPPPLPASVHRFSSTLRVASFSSFHFPDGTNAKALHLPFLEQLTLSDVRITESSLHAMLAGCSLLQSLLLLDTCGFPRLQIVSHSLRSLGVRSRWTGSLLEELHVVDAPRLQRLLLFGPRKIEISVISAPRLDILGEVFQVSTIVSMATVVHSVKILALSDVKLSLDVVIALLKCFPHSEKLYIKIKASSRRSVENACHDKYHKLIGSLDIRLRKIVLANYQGCTSHINFAKFFVSNARVLVSMTLESGVRRISKAWIARQRRLLNIKMRASKVAQFNFTSPKALIGTLDDVLRAEQVHDLSVTDPFQRFH